MKFCFQFLVLFFSVSISVNGKRNFCLERGDGTNIDSIGVSKLYIKHDSGTAFSWQAARGTINITYWSSGIEVDASDISTTGELQINLASVVKAFPGFLFLCAILCHMTTDCRKTGLLFIFLCVAALTVTNGQDDDQDCKGRNALHVQIPTAFVKELCINGDCRPTLCSLSLDSEFSQIPSNNEVIFSDDKCTIKKPEFWDEWLEHYFGNNSGQDYFGDIDGDGLVNILEYYGNEAFKDNFVSVGGVESQNVAESRKRRDLKESANILNREKRQTKTERFDALIARGSDPTNADSDGDLIPDGEERKFGTDPRKPDPIDEDKDNDGLPTLDEVIHGTDAK